jgi:hypothetical protein
MSKPNIYQERGGNRLNYLIDLSEEYDVPQQTVFTLADFLGPDEDFDGLVNALEDYEDRME